VTDQGPEVFEGRLPELVRTQLGELVQTNGVEILQDPRRVRAMLGDTIATARREINLISLALAEGVPERLQAVGADPLRVRAEIAALTRQLEVNHALHHDAAEWAVRSCAWSLGLDEPPVQFEPMTARPTELPSPSVPPPPSATPAPASSAGPPPSQPPATTRIADRHPRPAWFRWWPAALALLAALVTGGITVGALALRDGGASNNNDSVTSITVTPSGASLSPTRSGPTSPRSTKTQTSPEPTQEPPVTVPPPFESPLLYRWAKAYFNPRQCFTPTSGDAPVAMQTRDKELVKCGLVKSFSGTFWCKKTLAGLIFDRKLFVNAYRVGPKQRLAAAPAGDKRFVGYAVSFHHTGGGDPRVYWDSPGQLCAAEIQGDTSVTVPETVQLWRSGR